MASKTDRYRSVFIAAFLLALGTGLRFYQLDRALGGGDENQYLLDYGGASLKNIATTYFFGGHPVFHTLLLRLMIMGFGDENALAIRFPAFIAGIASLWLIYRVTLQLFDSLPIARLSLLIAALCPVHIYYSQIARGYSLVMFFSIAMVYSALRLLDSPEAKWGAILVLCGVLSVYTVPTNVYFIVALAVWMFLSLATRRAEEGNGKRAGIYLGLFLLMALLSYLVYLPLVDQVIAEANNYHLAHETETSRLVIAGRVPTGTLSLIFPGALLWFLPFLAVGMLFGDTIRPSHRLLTICIFFLPLLVPLLTGVSGYPRNYLYNLPLLVIFLSAGIVRAGKFLCLPARYSELSTVAIAFGYVLVASINLATVHYPSIHLPDGKLYQQKIRENSNPLDLIAIGDPRNYLYAQTVYKDNLKNILLLNKLSGIKLVASSPSQVEGTLLVDGHGQFQIFKGLFEPDNLKFVDVSEREKIFSIGSGVPVSILPEDFEVNTHWAILSGTGRFFKEPVHKLAGDYSLFLEGGGKENFVVESVVSHKIQVRETSFIVLVWSSKNADGSRRGEIYIPGLVVRDNGQGGNLNQLHFGRINEGVQNKLRQGSDEWYVNSFIGWLPPGEYSLVMQLAVAPAQSVAYDGFRLFVVEVAEK